MSTEIETNMKDHTVVSFWGGDDRGVCVQVTVAKMSICDSVGEQIQQEGFIRLTMEEAAALCKALGEFIREEAVRRQGLLRAELQTLKLAEKTVFGEVRDLAPSLMEVPLFAVDMVSKFCPKVAKAK
jgi:hypothetical protein